MSDIEKLIYLINNLKNLNQVFELEVKKFSPVESKIHFLQNSSIILADLKQVELSKKINGVISRLKSINDKNTYLSYKKQKFMLLPAVLEDKNLKTSNPNFIIKIQNIDTNLNLPNFPAIYLIKVTKYNSNKNLNLIDAELIASWKTSFF